ncbi:putative glucan 1,3-beta-glucosidase A [Morella rubra]|nr:putative glucan 1,3-beta-glucosidase A [Morella rubra]
MWRINDVSLRPLTFRVSNWVKWFLSHVRCFSKTTDIDGVLRVVQLWRINEKTFNFRVSNKQFVGLDTGGNGIDAVAVSTTPGNTETFEIVGESDDSTRVRIKAANGFFLQVKTEVLVTADFAGNSEWGDNDPSVFVMTISGRLRGEFQVTNGYGLERAPQEHWNTFIVEDDFKFISENGLNAARIPVGWWIASDPDPPQPYVGGSLKALDNAFLWATSSRDGSQEWGKTDDNIQQTVAVIDFLTARYAKSQSLYAVELINEPLSPEASLESLNKGKNNLFSNEFDNMTVQQNIDFIDTNRTQELNHVTTSNGPLNFVGEWVAEWQVSGATKEDYQRFARAQLDVYGRATFGWAYWTFRNVNNHWSLEWMIKNGYIKL